MSGDINTKLRYLGKLGTIEVLMGEIVEYVNTYYIEYSTFIHNTMPQFSSTAKNFDLHTNLSQQLSGEKFSGISFF